MWLFAAETKVTKVHGPVLERGEAEVGGSISPRHTWTNSETLCQTQEESPRKLEKEGVFRLYLSQGKDLWW